MWIIIKKLASAMLTAALEAAFKWGLSELRRRRTAS